MIFKTIFFALILVIAITLLRTVIGLITRTISDALVPPRPATPGTPQIPLSGELKRDPVCGTYISAASSIKKTVSGETLHFCSEACRDKHR